ncbi:MAG: hypothetical protein A2806_04375 [Candidatus Terrybacteria bacterium RIFCSPHIGHO2_01_FULL_48_17]|uniref:Uncharacterized protein n=1 Tax=Candidatus Terrybacteria bacterium RIFCSPHIGHO2_01_FULL_48_17 TaxID=1802362 RepID=A0A1G2PMP1_9BACT|nr:MAG: hypothetical protein A2806_04375 [Candidatus Terrybacteria bacterium RIFCSPHIGHO2_01_FULL_48_17]OHA52864.1 MAG: hypothetical protein A3A30_03140 [Candidatus Terrybacteria bacterium RIFCSPLOWO2_01_FULL_48_14]
MLIFILATLLLYCMLYDLKITALMFPAPRFAHLCIFLFFVAKTAFIADIHIPAVLFDVLNHEIRE